ncbi:MAG: prepilin-type N-terminal cleavage/methylation domain-containing protein [Nitrospirota bacterium]
MLNNTKGITLTELVVVCVVLSVLASVAMPIYRMSVKRAKEAALRLDLREMRDAIDAYKKLHDDGRISQVAGTQTSVTMGADTGYPKTLDDLTKLLNLVNPGVAVPVAPGTPPLPSKIRLLRKIPVDPMTGKAEWGMRSNADDPASTAWGGEDVFDVYSLSDGTALDGTKYKDW